MKGLVPISFLRVAFDRCAPANCVRWYVDVLRSEDGRVLRSVLDFEVVGQRRKGRLVRILKMQFEEDSVMVL